MKAVILAGGLGTRLREETHLRPKPMVEIGGMPILWHIMKSYSSHGITDFIICAGYKGYMIKEYFANYFLHSSDVTFNLQDNSTEIHFQKSEPWKVTVVDTGLSTMTGGRIRRVSRYVQDGTFCLTYGDGLADVDISSLVDFHRSHGKESTVTAVQPPGRYGALKINKRNEVQAFKEKPSGDGSWINGGFFVLEPNAINRICHGDETIWEKAPLESLAEAGELYTYKHKGFWHPMDTLRDKNELEELWDSGQAPWKTWN